MLAVLGRGRVGNEPPDRDAAGVRHDPLASARWIADGLVAVFEIGRTRAAKRLGSGRIERLARDTLAINSPNDFTAGLTVGTSTTPLAMINVNSGLSLNAGTAALDFYTRSRTVYLDYSA